LTTWQGNETGKHQLEINKENKSSQILNTSQPAAILKTWSGRLDGEGNETGKQFVTLSVDQQECLIVLF
jgi:hypothetical protein